MAEDREEERVPQMPVERLEPVGAPAPPGLLLVTDRARKAFARPSFDASSLGGNCRSTLDRVRRFLPTMAAAQSNLDAKLKAAGDDEVVRREISVEQVDDDGPYVEMTVGLVQQQDCADDSESDDNSIGGDGGRRKLVEFLDSADWSEDSDPDSPPSPPREGQDNDFTSDSDSDSTISTTSGSESSSSGSHHGSFARSSEKTRRKSSEFPRKRPMVQEVSPKDSGEERVTEEKAAKRPRQDAL